MVTHQCSRPSSGQSRGAPCTCPPCPEQPLAQYEEVAKQSHLPCNMQLAMSLLHDKIISLDKRKIQRCGKVNDGDGSVETVTCLWKQWAPSFFVTPRQLSVRGTSSCHIRIEGGEAGLEHFAIGSVQQIQHYIQG